MAEKYGLELDRSSWHDARRADGTPVEIKSTMHQHSDGQPGNFKLYKEYHDRLRDTGGWYVFAVYKPRGRGVTVLKTEMRHSSRLPLLTWHGGGDHRDTQQAKISISEIF